MGQIFVSAVSSQGGQGGSPGNIDTAQIRQIIGISKKSKDLWPLVPSDKLSLLASRGLLHPAIDDAFKAGITLGSRIRLSATSIEPSDKSEARRVLVADLNNIKFGKVIDCYQLDLGNVTVEEWDGMKDFSGNLTLQLDQYLKNISIGRKIEFNSLF